MNSNQDKPPDNEKPEEIIDEIGNILDALHTDMTKDAIEVGQAKDRFRALRPLWKNLGNANTSDPDVVDIYSSGTFALSAIRDDFRSLGQKYQPLHGLMGTVHPSTDSAVSITSTTASFFVSKEVNLDSDWPIVVDKSNREETRKKLEKLGSDISETYDAIWEVLYGTRSDPERGSMFLMRQVFDQFFGVLAPDDEVRNSKYWKKKAENDPDRVERSERIEYAAHVHIKNRTTASRLIASTKHILKVYKALNKAHNRSAIDSPKARTALKEMQTIIEDWVGSIA